ncbi:Zinc knuckle CX2CX4HX4C [Corchorus olitorius]|uniref:Zinc knuckle CX2CX4HX4C n=1 Tax=Corchorus olitorius TaxID=93759 RepID=A0A1R3HBH0_9ROSI|nr:Zinc knuckle CX2CX4HX4C [Corchorus olitorius]
MNDNNLNPPNRPRITLMRECSWTDSDSSSPDSGDRADNVAHGMHPRPAPTIRDKRGPRFRVTTQELAYRRNEGEECVVGFLVYIRRFNTNFVQEQINDAWELTGRATVMGHSDIRPRNIRFIRIRILIDPMEPLAPGCTLERDDGTTQWVTYSYERVHKLCLNCGRIGHTHPNYTWEFHQIERAINIRMQDMSERLGVPIEVEPDQPMYTNRMRAFLNRASRRTTRIYYRPRQRQPEAYGGRVEGQAEATSSEQQQNYPSLDRERPPGVLRIQENNQLSPQDQNNTSLHSQLEQEVNIKEPRSHAKTMTTESWRHLRQMMTMTMSHSNRILIK